MACDRAFYNDAMERFLGDPDSVMDAGVLLKAGRSSTLALVDINGRRLVIKRYNIKNRWHAIKRCCRPSRASVSWRNAHLLLFLGISTPRPILLLEKRVGPFRSRAYLVTEYVEGKDAYSFFHDDRSNSMELKGLVRNFKGLFRALAGQFISHGDC